MLPSPLMLPSPFQSDDQNAVAVLQSERLRMRVDLVELIAGARHTIAQSRALLAQADAILDREKWPLLQ